MAKVFGQNVLTCNPWCIQVELVEGCNRRCWFCGLLSLPEERKKGTNFIELSTLHKAFTELNGWLPKIRVEINLHGEPTMHPYFLECLETMRKAMPSCCLILQTNTDLWKDEAAEKIPSWFNVGLNSLVLNAYATGRYSFWKDKLSELGYSYVDYYHNNPDHLSYNQYYDPRKRNIFLLDDLGSINQDTKQTVSHPNKRFHNSAGSSNERVIEKKTGRKFKAMPLDSKCSKVFREVNLGFDGNVAVCCLDWQDVTVIGNVKETHIERIWNSERYWAIRQLLFRKRRDILLPCNTCSDHTMRTGLLKDPGIEKTDTELMYVILDTIPTTSRAKLELE